MDATLAQIIQHMVRSESDRARLSQRVQELEAENARLRAEVTHDDAQ